LATDYDTLTRISDTNRPFYHVNKVVVCPTSDNLAIQGVQFSLVGYDRADSKYYKFKNVDFEQLPEMELPMLGQEQGACFSFKLADEDHITQATVWYSGKEKLIKALQFETKEK